MNRTSTESLTGWTSNTTAEELASWIAGHRRVAILTHFKPDGDAIGSTIALCRALTLRAGGYADPAFPLAEAWYTGPQPLWLDRVVRDAPHRLVDATGIPEIEPDAVVITDTGSWSQLRPVREWLEPRRSKIAVVDHHLTGDADVADRRLLDTDAPAVCQPIAAVCAALLGVPGPAALPTEVAEPLYLGLATDTGWFRHSNVTPGTLRLAADLLEAGVDHARLYAHVQQQDRPQRLALLGATLGSLTMEDDDRIAALTIRESDVIETGAAPGESGGFIDLLLSLGSVEVAAVMTEVETDEPDGPTTKVSLRSKETERPADVSRVSRTLGGGGHARAAGCRIPGAPADVWPRLLDAIRAEMAGA